MRRFALALGLTLALATCVTTTGLSEPRGVPVSFEAQGWVYAGTVAVFYCNGSPVRPVLRGLADTRVARFRVRGLWECSEVRFAIISPNERPYHSGTFSLPHGATLYVTIGARTALSWYEYR